MADRSTPMLFAPPQPPFQLPVGETVVLGRSRECGLRLPDADTSRKHAKIVCEADAFVIHDLGSTNGTFVNGEQVATQTLRPGDRIEIGANQITFCEVGAVLDAAEDDEAQTQLFARPVRDEVFRGDLAEIPPFAVLQTLELGRKSGVVHFDSDATPGKLWLRRGEPVHAETKDQVGFDAAVALVNANLGRFVFEPKLEIPDTTIEASVTQLLLEASRLLDEGLC